jgi:hypothetical protein
MGVLVPNFCFLNVRDQCSGSTHKIEEGFDAYLEQPLYAAVLVCVIIPHK